MTKDIHNKTFFGVKGFLTGIIPSGRRSRTRVCALCRALAELCKEHSNRLLAKIVEVVA